MENAAEMMDELPEPIMGAGEEVDFISAAIQGAMHELDGLRRSWLSQIYTMRSDHTDRLETMREEANLRKDLHTRSNRSKDDVNLTHFEAKDKDLLAAEDAAEDQLTQREAANERAEGALERAVQSFEDVQANFTTQFDHVQWMLGDQSTAREHRVGTVGEWAAQNRDEAAARLALAARVLLKSLESVGHYTSTRNTSLGHIADRLDQLMPENHTGYRVARVKENLDARLEDDAYLQNTSAAWLDRTEGWRTQVEKSLTALVAETTELESSIGTEAGRAMGNIQRDSNAALVKGESAISGMRTEQGRLIDDEESVLVSGRDRLVSDMEKHQHMADSIAKLGNEGIADQYYKADEWLRFAQEQMGALDKILDGRHDATSQAIHQWRNLMDRQEKQVEEARHAVEEKMHIARNLSASIATALKKQADVGLADFRAGGSLLQTAPDGPVVPVSAVELNGSALEKNVALNAEHAQLRTTVARLIERLSAKVAHV
jgi:hypothetical protein